MDAISAHDRSTIRACGNQYASRLDASDQHAVMVEVYSDDAWKHIAESPENAIEFADAWANDFAQAEASYGRIAHFAAFMRCHGPLDAAALAAIGARVIAEMETVIAPAASHQADKFMDRAE